MMAENAVECPQARQSAVSAATLISSSSISELQAGQIESMRQEAGQWATKSAGAAHTNQMLPDFPPAFRARQAGGRGEEVVATVAAVSCWSGECAPGTSCTD